MVLSRPKKKSYDAEAVMQELLNTVDELYQLHGQIKAVAKELDLAELKVKKLLITSKRISYPQTEEIQKMLRSGASMSEVMDSLCLSRASINAYLPYSKVPYKESEISANADRCELYRKRKAAVEAIVDIESLWACIVLFAGYPFKTATGLKFTYKIGRDGKGKELFIDRKEKSITMSTVERAYEKIEPGRVYAGPKELGDLFGISYLYSIFYRFGLIDVPERIKDKMKL